MPVSEVFRLFFSVYCDEKDSRNLAVCSKSQLRCHIISKLLQCDQDYPQKLADDFNVSAKIFFSNIPMFKKSPLFHLGRFGELFQFVSLSEYSWDKLSANDKFKHYCERHLADKENVELTSIILEQGLSLGEVKILLALDKDIFLRKTGFKQRPLLWSLLLADSVQLVDYILAEQSPDVVNEALIWLDKRFGCAFDYVRSQPMKKLLLSYLVNDHSEKDRIGLFMSNVKYEIDELKQGHKYAANLTRSLTKVDDMKYYDGDYAFEFVGNNDRALNTDLKLQRMKFLLQEFYDKLRSTADKKSVGLLYFSGHGFCENSVQYLVPIGYDATMEAKDGCVSVDDVVREMSHGRENCTNIIILDCCRSGGNYKDGELTTGDIANVLIAYACPRNTECFGELTKTIIPLLHFPIEIAELFRIAAANIRKKYKNTDIESKVMDLPCVEVALTTKFTLFPHTNFEKNT